jgi:hypothetical protein
LHHLLGVVAFAWREEYLEGKIKLDNGRGKFFSRVANRNGAIPEELTDYVNFGTDPRRERGGCVVRIPVPVGWPALHPSSDGEIREADASERTYAAHLPALEASARVKPLRWLDLLPPIPS